MPIRISIHLIVRCHSSCFPVCFQCTTWIAQYIQAEGSESIEKNKWAESITIYHLAGILKWVVPAAVPHNRCRVALNVIFIMITWDWTANGHENAEQDSCHIRWRGYPAWTGEPRFFWITAINGGGPLIADDWHHQVNGDDTRVWSHILDEVSVCAFAGVNRSICTGLTPVTVTYTYIMPDPIDVCDTWLKWQKMEE